MLSSQFRAAAAVVFIFLWAATLSAQQQGGDQTSGGTGTTTGTGIGGEATPAESLDPDAVFTDVERGAAVGSTAETGQGFSDLSVSPTTGGGARGGIGGLGGGLGGGFGALGNLFGGAFGTGATQASKPVIRTRLRSAVSVPPTPPAQVQQVARQRFQSLPASQAQLRGINITMQGRTAVISGFVRSERDRRMSELLMRLEPGVSNVDNQVVVTLPTPPPSQ